MKVAAVIPAYNEAESVGTIVDETDRHVDRVVVVDDGSTDRTTEIARERGACVIQHVINSGVGAAVRTGYRYAIRNGFDFIVQIDADGQHDPEYIPVLLEAIEDADMVIGSRYLNQSYKEYPLVRQLGIRTFTSLVRILGSLDITDVTSGYRVYRVEKLTTILHQSDKHWAIEQTLEAARQNQRIVEVSIEMPTRETGESQFDVATLLLYPVRMADIILRILIFR